ncbi:cyclic GMP-AMP synthase isoform X2 [Monodelphis domestica]|uniref:cyclic GMP-AMP synthase isoform X2 n=1 Tax=Monodelphis domestica TaxID=13616 RepID=UPI00028BCE3D|nr:cyclic GMP-AMP synthase isoform X2 [Monodelphis domestica]
MEKAPATRRRSSGQGSAKKSTARTPAPRLPSQAVPDLTDAVPGNVPHSKRTESLREKKPLDFQEKLPARAPGTLPAKKLPARASGTPPAKKLPARAPGTLPAKKEPPHPEDGGTQRDKRPDLGEDRPSGALTAVSYEPEILPKEKRGPAGRENSVRRRLQRVVEKLRLRRQERSEACGLVNKVLDHLQRQLPLRDPAFKGIVALGTGSYYEQVKISVPNEFDVMLKLEVPRVELEEYDESGAFYFVKFKRNPKGNPLIKFLDNEILSASKLLSKFRKIIKAEVSHIKEMDIIVERKKPKSPAVTLLIRKPEEISVDIVLALELRSSWPPSTQGGLTIETWLGRKVKMEFKYRPVYLVPKSVKEGNGLQANTWRLSFSHIEKDIIRNHGSEKTCCEMNGVPCCRKKCLKLMKYLLEKLKKKFENRKELDKFHSYHMKTAFFHVCAQKPNDSQWQLGDLERCFDDCVLSHFL